MIQFIEFLVYHVPDENVIMGMIIFSIGGSLSFTCGLCCMCYTLFSNARPTAASQNASVDEMIGITVAKDKG